MLLPSALTCDSSLTMSTPKRKLFASPPLSPPSSSSSSTHPAITNIYSTCRALQSMLSPPPQQEQPSQLPSPPTIHADAPFKKRLRARSTKPEDTLTRRKIIKRAAAPPRGMNKRRRALDDDMTREDTEAEADSEDEDTFNREMGPSTPKRARLAPEVLPLGLERSDFHDLRLQEVSSSQELVPSVENDASGNGNENENEEWSTEDDRILVELVLEKLKLTKSDWQDCARSLGKDRGSVGRRWKSLMVKGEVGLKASRSSRRAKIHGTWR